MGRTSNTPKTSPKTYSSKNLEYQVSLGYQVYPGYQASLEYLNIRTKTPLSTSFFSTKQTKKQNLPIKQNIVYIQLYQFRLYQQTPTITIQISILNKKVDHITHGQPFLILSFS